MFDRKTLVGAVADAAAPLGERAVRTVRGENLDKHVLELRTIQRHTGPDGAVVDLGGGVGINLLALRRLGHRGRLTLVDRFDEYDDDTSRMGTRGAALGALDSAGVEVIQQSFWPDCDLDLPPQSFDVATCFDVIEHLPGHPLRQLSELRRLLRPGGTCIVSGPNATSLMKIVSVVRGVHPYAPYESWLHEPYFEHYREYVRHEYADLLLRAGFERVEARWVAPVTTSRARARYHRRYHAWWSPVTVALWAVAGIELVVPPLRHSALVVGRRPTEGSPRPS